MAIEVKKAACSSANAQEKGFCPAQGHLLCLKFARSRCRAKKRHILENANDWKIVANVNRLRHYPQVLVESSKRPDVLLSSTKADMFVLSDLKVPQEGRNTLKEDRCMELTMDLHQKGYEVWFLAFEVGARGMVGQST